MKRQGENITHRLSFAGQGCCSKKESFYFPVPGFLNIF